MFRRISTGFLWFLASIIVIGLFWLASSLGPKQIDFLSVDKSNYKIPPEVLKLQEDSLDFESQFESILALRQPTEGDIELLQQAVRLQKAYLDEIIGYDVDADLRLRVLMERYEEFVSLPLFEKSQKLELEAASKESAKEYTQAYDFYQEAYQIQKSINEDFSSSPYANSSRATLLNRKAQYVLAEPIFQTSIELERKSDLAIKNKEWEKALELLDEAIEVQNRINREFRNSKQGSALRLDLLNKKLLGIQSGQDNLAIIDLTTEGEILRAKGDMLDAASCFQEAARLQRNLNTKYPDSPHASNEKVLEFERKSQTAQSYGLGLSIERNHDKLTSFLAERRTYDAQEVIAKLTADIKYLRDAFPKSSLYDEEMNLKIRYLNIIQNDIGFIQDRVYELLLPIPDIDNLQMTRTEINQALYTFIMGDNPSRNMGEKKPVDSVSWLEAKDFCKRLGWILGREVRLPTQNEFRSALGPLRYVVLEEHSWNLVNAKAAAQPVGQKKPFSSGYHDLLGNVSEWLESVDSFADEDARHIGGHAGDRLDVLFNVPVRETPRAERNRMTGFRFVVKFL